MESNPTSSPQLPLAREFKDSNSLVTNQNISFGDNSVNSAEPLHFTSIIHSNSK